MTPRNETHARRYRRRMASLGNASQTLQDRAGRPIAPEFDPSARRGECAACGRVDALTVKLCRYCFADYMEEDKS